MAKQRSYYKKKYVNPFFKKTKGGFAGRGRGFYYGAGGGGSWLSKFILFLVIIAAGAFFYFIFYSSYFSIKNIKISGLEKINESEIRDIINAQINSRRIFIFKQSNIFIFDEILIKNKIDSKYALNFLKVEKGLPGNLNFEIQEKTPIIIWKTGDKYYFVDKDGIIIREILEGESWDSETDRPESKMAVVFDENNENVAIKETILTVETVQAVAKLQNILFGITGLSISNFRTTKHGEAIKGLTNEGWETYFSATNDLNAQIEKLKLFLGEKKPEDRQSLEYVDLRFPDRIYYK